MQQRREWRTLILVILGIGLITQVLGLVALWQNNNGFVFGGVYFNPLDGYSYLAKMRQGWQGNWQFHLPYTSEAGNSSYLFIFYLILGHIAHWFGLDLPVTFHLSRLVFTLFLYYGLYKFIKKYIRDPSLILPAFLLCGFGSGLGWLSLLFGKITPDFWLAEAYTFLSSFANPHFPLGILLLLSLLYDIGSSESVPSTACMVRNFILAICLALVFPFGIILVIAIATAAIGMDGLNYRYSGISLGKKAGFSRLMRSLPILIGGVPILLYQVWVIRSDDLLSNWNLQNITPSPMIADLAIAFMPVLLLSLPGGWAVIKKGSFEQRLILIWGITGLVLSALPFALQRRFLMAEYIPLGMLSVIGLKGLTNRFQPPLPARWFKRGFLILFMLSIPTNFLIMMSTLIEIRNHNPLIYLTLAEKDSFGWIDDQLPKDAIILADGETSLFIPPYTGRRVIYGHPFETVNAAEEEAFVKAFFSSQIRSEDDLGIKQSLGKKRVDYLFWGPRERISANVSSLTLDYPYLLPIYQNETVVIYKFIP